MFTAFRNRSWHLPPSTSFSFARFHRLGPATCTNRKLHSDAWVDRTFAKFGY